MQRVRREVRRYADGADRPMGGYTALLTAYGITGGALLGLMASRPRRQIPRLTPSDLVLMSVATFKVSRVLARDPITSPLRAPFTTFEGQADTPSELRESVRGSGLRKAVGELITCPFCTGQWVATALTAGWILAPRRTRLIAGLLTATAAADALHLGYSAAATAAG